jgi:hypothetical protein
MRGYRTEEFKQLREERSIPADAGLPMAAPTQRQTCKVYPRGCGATPAPLVVLVEHLGLSPRMRGYLNEALDNLKIARSIPADAGLPLLQFVRTRALRAHRSVYHVENATVCRRMNQHVLGYSVARHIYSLEGVRKNRNVKEQISHRLPRAC